MVKKPDIGGREPSVILADRIDAVRFDGRLLRIACVAWAPRGGQKVGMFSGVLVLTPNAALELRGQLDQALVEMAKRGEI